MQCHYCEGEADVAVEKGHLTVGLCEAHFEERLEDLADTEWFATLDEQVDLDSAE